MTNTVKLEEIDLEFLPLIYDIIRSIEKEMNEGGGTGSQRSGPKEQTEVHNKIQALTDKFKKAKEKLMMVEGIDGTRDQQIKELDLLTKQFEMKRQLLAQYKHFSPIDSSLQT